jgi:hypothetical protein
MRSKAEEDRVLLASVNDYNCGLILEFPKRRCSVFSQTAYTRGGLVFAISARIKVAALMDAVLDEEFKYAALMDAVLDEAEAQPASKYHVVSINLAPGSNFPTDEEVQYMSLMDLRDLSDYESGDLSVCVG